VVKNSTQPHLIILNDVCGFIMKNVEREECISCLLKLGAEDLTAIKHPNKLHKKYLRLRVKDTSWIDFNFDYPEYQEVSVRANRRNSPKGEMKFSEVKPMLKEIGFLY
jgi:hypothetical protein